MISDVLDQDGWQVRYLGANTPDGDLLKMVDEFYTHNGWDKKGVPTPETLRRLDLDQEPTHLL